jgi:uncharacterized integral membrane protein (TIGR00697 family)
MILGISFCVCLITSNLLSTKIISIGNITTITGGIIIFPILYIINDCITEVYGFKKMRLIIWLGFLSSFLIVMFTQIAVILPSPEFWNGETAFNFIFGLTPRVFLASFIAFLFGSFLNALLMSKMKIASKGKHFSFRAIVSTVIGETTDSIIFFPLAFGGILPMKDLLTMIATQIFLKSLYECLILPITIQFVTYLKEAEGEYFDDADISYNILKIKDIL